MQMLTTSFEDVDENPFVLYAARDVDESSPSSTPKHAVHFNVFFNLKTTKPAMYVTTYKIIVQ